MNTVIMSKYTVMRRQCRKMNQRTALMIRAKSFNAKKSTESRKAYCIQLVKKRDWEGYISTLPLPQKAGKAAFAIRAFNTEISQVASNVSETAIGYMRLQFWKNSLDAIYEGKPPDSPIATELHDAVTDHNLSKVWLKRMIKAREDCLAETSFKSIRELEDYADNTATAQLCLMLQCLGVDDVHADHVASHIGKCQGIMTMIRATPYHAVRRNVQLPLDFLIKHSVSQEEVFRGSQEQKVKDLIFDLASQASIHLEHARSMTDKLSNSAKKAFLITASLDWYMKQLQLADFDVFHPDLQQRNHKLPFSVFVQNLLKRV